MRQQDSISAGEVTSIGRPLGKPVTRLVSYLCRPRLERHVAFLQRAYMKISATVRQEREFRTAFGIKMQGDISDYVSQRIFFFGFWEPNLTRFMAETIRPGAFAVDVGANVGYFSLLMSRLVGRTGAVFSFEASPRTFARLRKNIELNDCSNVLAQNLAISDRNGEIALFDSRYGDRNTGMATTIQALGGTTSTLVSCNTLTEALGPDLVKVSFIKIDVEGAELPILQEIIAKKDRFAKPLVVVSEILENPGVVEWFQSENFECFFLSNDTSVSGYLKAFRDVGLCAPTPLKSGSVGNIGGDLVAIYRG
jgi:FkbM family methyltransferase